MEKLKHAVALCETAPHSCDDPSCPGDINRRKLEAAEGMANLLVEISKNLNQYHPMTKKVQQMISTWEKAGKGEG